FIICLFTFLCSSFFLAPPTTEFYPLSLHDALPIFDLVTVLAPVNAPSGGYVVYEDTRRAAAGRRLNRTLDALHEAGISAHGLVVDRKSTRLNSSHVAISYAVFCLKKKIISEL